MHAAITHPRTYIRVTLYDRPRSPVREESFGIEPWAKELEIWGSKINIAPMDSRLEVSEAAEKREPKWSTLVKLSLNVVEGSRTFRVVGALQKLRNNLRRRSEIPFLILT